MKHIKHYESKEKYTPSQFSDYIAWLSDKDIKIVKNKHKINFYQNDKNQPVLEVNPIYSYNTLDNSLTKIDENTTNRITGLFLDTDTVQNRILYQSDNIQNCLDMLPILSSQIKYNL